LEKIFLSLDLPDTVKLKDCVSQKFISTHIHQRNFDLLHESLSDSDQLREVARILATSDKAASSFLNAVPNEAFGTKMVSAEFQTALQYRLGIPFLLEQRKQRCSGCQKELDIWGDHGLECKFGGGLIRRHDDLRDITFAACSQSHFNPKKEVNHLLPESSARPGDIFIPVWNRGRPAALDITVSSTMQTNLLKHASMKAGYVAEQAELRKDTKSFEKAKEAGIEFIPLALESFGIWTPLALGTLRTICSRMKHFAVLDRAYPHFQFLVQKLSICLQRHNANLILEKYSSFLNGWDIPPTV
jgi:hypothetical protein